MPTLQIVVASTRPGRVGLPIGRWVQERAVAHGGFAVELVDLAEVNLPFLDEPKHPRLGAYEHQHSKDWSATIARGDAFVIVTPEYNHSFNAPLKNAIDYLYAEWQHKPVGFVSYGGVAAGTRAVQALKPILTQLKMTPVVESVPIAFFGQYVDGQGQFQGSEALNGAAVGMFNELKRLDAILGPTRPTRTGSGA
jgi:NAD(P)H-dependent FMN reductase